MDPELFQRMQEAAARFKSGESDFEEILTPAGPVHLVRDPDDPRGFRLDFVEHGAKRSVPVQRYPAARSRPAGWPAPLPFLPDCAATVNTLDQTVTWEDPPGGGHAFEHLLRELEEDGWEEVGDAPAELDDSMRRVLEKGDERRTLALETGDDVTRLVLSLKG